MTGYPGKSMLSEALHYTFLGKYFYFGFKVIGVCTDNSSTCLKDVLNLDTSLVSSQLDCTSNFDNCHTLAHQMLACSDDNFASVTYYMRILVKTLRTGSKSGDKTPGKLCDIQDGSNHSSVGGKGCNETLNSKSLTESPGIELGLSSVCFSFENSNSITGSASKLEHSKSLIYKSTSSKNVHSSSVKVNQSSMKETTSFSADHVESPAVNSYTSTSNDCGDRYSEHYDHHYDEYTSMLDTLSHLNIPQNGTAVCADHHVSQKFLFNSPNKSSCSNTSKKIDRELFRREILNSVNQTGGQLAFFSERSLLHQNTINSTRNDCNYTIGSKKAELEKNHTLGNVSETGFPENRTAVDYFPLPCTSILKNQLAEEVAMPDSEDLNAFFDSEFDGIVFTQDDDTSDIPNNIVSKNMNNDDDSNKTGDRSFKLEDGDYNKSLNQEDSGAKLMRHNKCASDNNLNRETHESNKNNQKSAVKLNETYHEKVSDTHEIAKEKHESTGSDKTSHELIAEVNVVSRELNDKSNVLTNSNISQLSMEIKGNSILNIFFADLSKCENKNHEVNAIVIHNVREQIETSKLFDSDLEQFFADISKYEIDEHVHITKQIKDSNVANHNNDNNCDNEKLTNVVDDRRIVHFVSDSHSNSSDMFSQNGALNSVCFKMDDSGENNEILENNSVCSYISWGDLNQQVCIKERSSLEVSDKSDEKRKVAEKTLLTGHMSLNDPLIDQLCSDFAQISNCSQADTHQQSKSVIEVNNDGTGDILVENSFDASGDLFNSPSNTSPAATDKIDVIVDDSVLDDIHDFDNIPVDASTPGLDECTHFDDLDCVVYESDSEIDTSGQSNDRRVVKFDHKLRRVSTCNVMDLKMRVVESPVLKLDKNIHLKSCLKVRKQIISTSPGYEQCGNTYCDRTCDMTKSDNLTKKCLILDKGASELCKVSRDQSYSHDASMDLFGDSFHKSILVNSVSDTEINLIAPESEAITSNTCQKITTKCSSDKENNNSERKVGVMNENLKCNARKPVLTRECLDTIHQNNELSNSVLEDIFSPDIFENSDFEQSWSSLGVRNHGITLHSNNTQQRNGAIKDTMKVTKNFKCSSKPSTANQLPNQRSPLKCIVMNTPDCNVSLSIHRVQKLSNCTSDNKQSGSLDFQNRKYSIANQSNINNEEDNLDTQDFIDSHSSFYSPDLFSDSILESNDNERVCDTSVDVLCKKLSF
ncbi:hypothetical protein ACF0H5_010462 [Mactra antiquata]